MILNDSMIVGLINRLKKAFHPQHAIGFLLSHPDTVIFLFLRPDETI